MAECKTKTNHYIFINLKKQTMSNKLFKSFFAFAMVLGAALGFVACTDQEEPTSGDPKVELSQATANFSSAEASQTVTVKANCKWTVEVEGADWVTIAPMEGKNNGSFTVAVAENTTGAVRSVEAKVYAWHETYGKFGSVKLAISQSADENVTVDEELLYSDDFDGETATKEYGSSNSSWPYIDQFPQFANAKGSAAANVTYTGNKVSVRANQPSNTDTQSTYAGSGNNNIFFGDGGYFVVNNIAPLKADCANYKMTFGLQKYGQSADNSLNTTDFLLYLSKDGENWAPINYTFPANAVEGKYNVVAADFTLAAVPEALYIKFVAKVASVFRIDDLKFFAGNGGQNVDLDNVEVVTPELPEMVEVTAAEFLAAAEDATVYKLTGEITRVANTTYGNFDITDATGTVYVYGLLTPSGEQQKQFAAAGLKEGDTITVYGTRSSYNGAPQMKNATYISHIPGEGGNTGGNDEPNTPATGVYESDSAFVCSTDDSTNAAYSFGATTINGNTVTGFKLGKSKQAGKFTSGVVSVSGNKYLNFYAQGWKDGDVTLYFRVDGGATMSQKLASHDGVTGNPPYTALAFAETDHYSVLLEGLTETSTIEFSTDANFELTTADSTMASARAIVCGVKLSDEPISAETPSEPENPGTGEDPENPTDVVKATVAEFLAAAEGTTVYELTGVIKNVANTNYGNFDLQDETGTVYVYGLYDESGNKVFTSLGLKEGDTLTMRGVRTSYNDVAQVGSGVYVSHVVSAEQEQPSNEASLSFADAANRLEWDTNHQIWSANGITLTNNKGASTSNVADYVAPARFYKSSEIIVECDKAFSKIEFFCNNATYATALQNSITSGNVTADGSSVIVTFDSAVTSYTVASLTGGQVRMNKLNVTFAE